MTFDRKDLQDDNNDDFSFDDFNGDDNNGDSFRFDDDVTPDIPLEDDDQGFGFEDRDMPSLEDEGEEGQGLNRNFIIIAALMIILFVIGLGAVLFLATREQPPTPNQLTATAIVEANATTAALLSASQTAAVEIAFAQTQTAAVPPTATLPPTATPIPTDTPTPTVDATQAFQNALLTQTAREATQTAEFLLTPPTRPPLGQSDVALTATALALIINPPPTVVGGLGSPTPEGLRPTPGVAPTALPDTGLFDDIASGTGGLGALALMALGLVAVIFVSRRLRTNQ